MSTSEPAGRPPMPEWAGEHEEVDAPLPDGRARVYYRWPGSIEAPGRRPPAGARAGADGTPPGSDGASPGTDGTPPGADGASPGTEPWTPEAGPARDDG